MSSKLASILLAASSIGFAIPEMCLSNKGVRDLVQHLLGDKVNDPAAWAANQGLYNLFLAAGLIWAAFAETPNSVSS